MNSLQKRYGTSLSLLTDLYQLTMSYGYWKTGRAEEKAVFNLFYRKAPFKGDYAIFCGLEDVLDLLNNFSFDKEATDYLKGLKGNDGNELFTDEYLNYLSEST